MGGAETAKERRAQVIEAAIGVLSHESIGEATTRKITAEAGINGAALNYYFGSKNDLLLALLGEILQQEEELF